jgi:hypothetical protein
MSALHAAVLNAFKSMGWEYHVVPDAEVVETWFEAHHTKVLVHAQSHAEAGILSVVSNGSFPVPDTHRKAACELLMRTNKELNLGNFEMDWDSGQVMFRVSNIFSPNRFDERVIASLVHASVAEIDRLTPYLAEVCRTEVGMLLLLDIPALMLRDDLLPNIPELETPTKDL